MLSTNTALIKSLTESTSVKAIPKVILEYSMNEMAGYVETIGNYGSASQIIKDLFPASSVVQSFRPAKAGVKYAILGQSNTLQTYKTKTIPASRTYMVDKDIPYTYFLAQGSGSVTINYKNKTNTAAQNILTNKISVRIETGHGTGSISIGSLYNGTVPADGVIDIWLNGSTWSTTEPATYSTPISISSLVVSVSGSSFNSIIDISPKYVVDVTDRVISVNVEKDDSLNDDKLPVGMLTANSCSINLSTIANGDIIQFIKGDAIVSNKIMITDNVKCKVIFSINDTYDIQQGIFYINDYSSGDYGDYSIKCLDIAKFLQSIPCPELLINDSSFQAIIWRILDAVGFVSYDFSKCTADVLSCRYWWGDANKSVWQAIQELCRESQTVGYINEYGVLVFIDRSTFYNSATTSSWTFRYAASGDLKPDIEQMSASVSPTTNAVKIKYNVPTTSNQEASAQPVWTEQAPSTLFASPYKGITDGYLLYPERGVFSDVIPTRFNSYVLVGEEIIEYDGIQFSSPDGVVDITSSGQYLELRAKHNNNLIPTGKLKIKTRNAFGTPTTTANPVNNPTQILNGYSAKQIKLGTATNNSVSLSKVCALNQSGSNISALAISASGSKDDLYVVTKNFQYANSDITQIGTSVGFELASESQIGLQQKSGMVFNWNPATVTGYLVLIYTTRTAQDVKQKSEVVLYKVVNGIATLLRTATANVFEQSFYGIDVLVKKVGTTNYIKIYVNGSSGGTEDAYVDSVNAIPQTQNIGILAGGQSTAYFDYLYAFERPEFKLDLSAARSSGKLIANSFFQNFKFEDGSNSTVKYDEFGAVVRELYKAEAQYQQSYAIGAQASDGLAQVVSTRLGHFKGELFIFNTASATISLSGADGQKDLFIYGQMVANAGQNYYNSNDKITDAKQVTTFDTTWIQTRDAAESLSKFIMTQWAKSTTNIEMSIFGNPIIQVGDIVSISYPDRGFDGTGKFVVRSVSHDLSTGLSTKIKLRSIYLA